MEIRAYFPQIVLVAGGLAIILLDLLLPEAKRGSAGVRRARWLVACTTLFAIGAGAASWSLAGVSETFTTLFRLIFPAVVLLVAWLAPGYLVQRRLPVAEFYALLTFSAAGMMTLAGATNLIHLYLGLELMSQSLYALAGLANDDPRSSEAALKYFLMGSLGSAVTLFGVVLLYGSSGTFDLAKLALLVKNAVPAVTPIPAWTGIAGLTLVLVGLGLKVAAVPFHMWVPDAYEGAPNPVTALFAVGPKAAGMAALVRIMASVFPTVRMEYSLLFALVATATMTLGNLAALSQTNIKRMMGYSSIAQAGYLLAVLAVPTAMSVRAFLFYVVAYAAATIGAFAVITWWGTDHPENQISDYRQLGQIAPLPALALTVCFFSLVGVPPTAGFMGKLYLFSAAVQNRQIWFAVVLVVNSVLSVPYYYGVMRQMFFPAPASVAPLRPRSGLAMATVASAAVTLVFLIGLNPEPLFKVTSLAFFRLP